LYAALRREIELCIGLSIERSFHYPFAGGSDEGSEAPAVYRPIKFENYRRIGAYRSSG